MKAGILAVAAAALAGGASAADHHAARRHAHKVFHERGNNGTKAESTCGTGCTTIYEVVTGAMTLYNPPAPTTTLTSTQTRSSTATVLAVSSSSSSSSSTPAAIVPTAFASTASTTGVYTIPASTLTLSSSTEVLGVTTTLLPSSGTYTAGGLTTTVPSATTVTVPYATSSTSSGVVTSVILTTTYVCPSAGTYTIAPLTTSCTDSSVWVYPTAASYSAGTYTRSETVTTITETDYVIYCPFATSEAAAATSVSAAAITSVAPVTSVAAVTSSAPVVQVADVVSSVVAAATSEAAVVVSAVSSVASVVSSAISSAASSVATSVSGELGNSGEQYGITYTPYTTTGDCKAASDVTSDIASIAAAGFQVVRVYSSDCSALANVGSACKASGIKMILGVYISSTGISGAADQVTAIASWAQWDLVELIVVGNEAISNGYASASALAAFISSTATTFNAAGYTGPYTTAEPLSSWQAASADLCPVVDIIGCNLHAYFNSATTASEAGTFVQSEMEIAAALCSGKQVLNLESGWPSAGNTNGAAVAGKAEQALAIASLKSVVGGHTVVFSMTNDLWKDAGSCECEQSWGCFDLY